MRRCSRYVHVKAHMYSAGDAIALAGVHNLHTLHCQHNLQDVNTPASCVAAWPALPAMKSMSARCLATLLVMPTAQWTPYDTSKQLPSGPPPARGCSKGARGGGGRGFSRLDKRNQQRAAAKEGGGWGGYSITVTPRMQGVVLSQLLSSELWWLRVLKNTGFSVDTALGVISYSNRRDATAAPGRWQHNKLSAAVSQLQLDHKTYLQVQPQDLITFSSLVNPSRSREGVSTAVVSCKLPVGFCMIL